MDYTTLSLEDKLLIARDLLRGRESDHYRLSLMDPKSAGGPDRLGLIEAEIAKVKKDIKDLEAQRPK